MGSSRRFAVVVTAVVAVVVTGCAGTAPNTPLPGGTATGSTGPAQAAPTTTAAAAGHRALLLEPEDINSPEDRFSATSVTDNPGGQEGVSTFYVNQDDTRAIQSTILVLPDAAAAAQAKDAALSSAAQVVTAGPPEPISVGDGGMMLSGTAPDGSKAVTLVLFTQNRAAVRMEFGSETADPVPTDRLTDIAQKQSIAIRAGLLD